jgi:hypothetical protein
MGGGSGPSDKGGLMATEYLLKEYCMCYEQLRFYDSRHSELLKYLFTLTSAVATAQFAIYKFLEGPTPGFFGCQALLSIIVFVATLLLYAAMLQNRLYFVFTARQLNAIRDFFMRTEAGAFKNNQLYTSTDFPAFKPSSVHTFHLIGAAFISSIFAGLSSFAILPACGRTLSSELGIAVAVIVAISEIAGGIKYLLSSGKGTADETIHGSKKKKPEQQLAPDEKSHG